MNKYVIYSQAEAYQGFRYYYQNGGAWSSMVDDDTVRFDSFLEAVEEIKVLTCSKHKLPIVVWEFLIEMI